MDKEKFKQLIKELFESSELEIEVDETPTWSGKYLSVAVLIDGNQVYKNETYVSH